MSTKLPTFFKNEDGFCYAATEALATMPNMTPWNGDVDEKGFATEAKAAKPAAVAKAQGKGKSKAEVAPEPEPTPEPAVNPEPVDVPAEE